MLFADLLSLHLVTFSMFFILVLLDDTTEYGKLFQIATHEEKGEIKSLCKSGVSIVEG